MNLAELQHAIEELPKEIEDILDQSPSLGPKIEAHLARDYEHAVRLAGIETGLPLGRFPREWPFTVEQILDREFLP